MPKILNAVNGIRGLRKGGMVSLIPALLATSALGGGQGDINDLLPTAESVEPWKTAEEAVNYEGYELFDFIDGGAELFFQYGFVEAVSQDYVRGDDSLVCTIYEMEDPESAYGVFSYSRSPDKPALAIGDDGFAGGLQVVFWQDRYYVSVETFAPGEELERAVESFARRISERIGRHAEKPEVMERLPRDRLIPRSEKLFEGNLTVDSLLMNKTSDLFQLAPGDVVLYGEYQASLGRMKLFMAVYEDRSKAGRLYPIIQDSFRPEEGYQALKVEGRGACWIREGLYTLLRPDGDDLVLVTGAQFLNEAEEIARQE